ncbi:ribonuclease catalytic domain-containing protein [Treponema bryantii]|uniref:ribonuclease catalytic domain-containing protein n=1 Tax=Treponema bryantii TaxID=163 RepID=UPI0003B32484|nr:RNB domain-containing ribonuclease [Treponema bryantii]
MNKNSLVLYKNQCALVTDRDGDKYLIRFCSQPATPGGKKAVYGEQKVREKDVVLLHEGPVSSLENVLAFSDDKISAQLEETHELLLSDESTAGEAISLSDLAEYARGAFAADEAWAFYSAVGSSVLFAADAEALKNGKIQFIPRSSEEVEALNKKQYEKEHEAEIRAAFIKRVRERKLDLPDDAKFMGEVEAFALCKTDKCRVLVDAGVAQTIEAAHRLLIDTGIWDFTKNPYPTRYGFSFDSAKDQLGAMPSEERLDVPGVAYAIDSEHSADPDDAVAFDGEYLWVHIADPASSVEPDSKIDIAARDRGTTLYIPEGTSRMLCESCLEDYALGLKEDSHALSFRIKLDGESQIEECQVFKTNVKVKRLTYKYAEEHKEDAELKPLFEIARKNKARREKNGAVTIQMPEVDISVDKETKKVTIEPEARLESNEMIAELMILAGEGAARFAFKNQIPFMYISQEAPDFPGNLPDGWAGQFARIKCMRKRSVGITPAPHAGLGVSFYSQVTSPLRRYGDLISHEQLRAFIDGRHLIAKDDMLERVAAGDAASIAAKKASRQSDTHWKLVYLLQNPDAEYEAFCIDRRGNDALFLIPSLDMQATLRNCSDVNLNDAAVLKMSKVDIPEQKVDFSRIR